jgi:protein gp37
MDKNGNMYEGVVTWNPLGGECSHRCPYCSTNTLKKRYGAVRNKYSGPLQLYPGFPKSTDKTVFVCAQNDLFAESVPDKWIDEILSRCNAIDNTYLFQTKNPERYWDFEARFPKKSILCTTIETNRYYRVQGNTPDPDARVDGMRHLLDFTKHVTIEPIMDFDLDEMIYLIRNCYPDQVNIGADSKHNHLPEPSKEKVLELISELEKFTVVKQKSNLSRLLNQ